MSSTVYILNQLEAPLRAKGDAIAQNLALSSSGLSQIVSQRIISEMNRYGNNSTTAQNIYRKPALRPIRAVKTNENELDSAFASPA